MIHNSAHFDNLVKQSTLNFLIKNKSHYQYSKVEVLFTYQFLYLLLSLGRILIDLHGSRKDLGEFNYQISSIISSNLMTSNINPAR